ncbi:hypothetical protein [Burkholderia stagnalis]|nr:hypothetical protein [Burkholderia stagnalis]
MGGITLAATHHENGRHGLGPRKFGFLHSIRRRKTASLSPIRPEFR